MHARHGLAGRLHWADVLSVDVVSGETSPPERTEALRRQSLAATRVRIRIARARKSKRSRGLSAANTISAFEYARTMNLVQWLVEHPTERDQLESVVELLVKASSDLLAGVQKSKRKALKARILDHLWCDLIASIVCAVEQFGSLEEKAKEEVAVAIAAGATALLKSARAEAEARPARANKDGTAVSKADLDADADLSVDGAILQGCIRGVVHLALDGATAGLDAYLKTILIKLRVAGVMLCPDVTAHEKVWRHCWLPLWKHALFDALLEELAEFVPALKTDLPNAPIGSAGHPDSPTANPT
ncbi:hypothetical protein QFZ53_002836 [Microbacterium natoriense]|uniref:Uncharacterized protein n=2 Tax=Microbacterium natoriense TaxID=284570 RepID=A0AAW8EYW2_9MICO|nr:hypothetical protein [Microbacterium natoriense]